MSNRSVIDQSFLNGYNAIHYSFDMPSSSPEKTIDQLLERLNQEVKRGRQAVDEADRKSMRPKLIGSWEKNVKKILEESAKKAPHSIFILETAAGAGTECCKKLEQLAEFRDKFTKDEKKRIRFCLDTCHMFSAGYDYRTEKQVVQFEKEVESTIKWKNVELLHFNDSKAKHGSGVDRHESIGEGYIGNTGLREIAKIACKKGIPMILETPKDKVEKLKKEIDMVSSWCS